MRDQVCREATGIRHILSGYIQLSVRVGMSNCLFNIFNYFCKDDRQ